MLGKSKTWHLFVHRTLLGNTLILTLDLLVLFAALFLAAGGLDHSGIILDGSVYIGWVFAVLAVEAGSLILLSIRVGRVRSPRLKVLSAISQTVVLLGGLIFVFYYEALLMWSGSCSYSSYISGFLSCPVPPGLFSLALLFVVLALVFVWKAPTNKVRDSLH
jgi:hypothetical protein